VPRGRGGGGGSNRSASAREGAVLTTVSKFVQGLKPGANNNWLGYCPLHGEVPGRSKPSFSFNSETGLWNCFSGCGGGGLPQLLKLVGRSGTFVDKTMARLRPYLKEPARKSTSSHKEGLFLAQHPLPEKLLGLYEYAPVDLLNTGFDKEVLYQHDIGFDRELGRITYPVRDLSGTLAGIVGKPIGDDGPGKYVVYEKELQEKSKDFRNYSFDNHRFVWRWERVYQRLYCSEEPTIIYVTEGFKACLWMVQHGFPDTVALMGTKLSTVQQKFLERLGGTVILCLDDDHWGRAGTRRIGYKLRGLRVKVIHYPYRYWDLQPDDLTEEELLNAINNAYTYTRWRREWQGAVRSG